MFVAAMRWSRRRKASRRARKPRKCVWMRRAAAWRAARSSRVHVRDMCPRHVRWMRMAACRGTYIIHSTMRAVWPRQCRCTSRAAQSCRFFSR
jgi:hypothetical protein